jgi:hypothetical protein
MSLVKTVPKGIRDKECNKFALRERPPVPYMPEKDPVQETVSTLKSDQNLKTTIGEDAELCLPIWHCGTLDAFLMHLSTALDAIKKRGTFKAYKEAVEAYVEQQEVVKKAKAALALLVAPSSKGKKASKKALAEKSPEKALQKTKENVALANSPAPDFRMSIRPSMTRPTLQRRPPRTSTKPLLPRCFSSKQICCLWMSSMGGTRQSRSRRRLIHSRIFMACPRKTLAGVIQ